MVNNCLYTIKLANMISMPLLYILSKLKSIAQISNMISMLLLYILSKLESIAQIDLEFNLQEYTYSTTFIFTKYNFINNRNKLYLYSPLIHTLWINFYFTTFQYLYNSNELVRFIHYFDNRNNKILKFWNWRKNCKFWKRINYIIYNNSFIYLNNDWVFEINYKIKFFIINSFIINSNIVINNLYKNLLLIQNRFFTSIHCNVIENEESWY